MPVGIFGKFRDASPRSKINCGLQIEISNKARIQNPKSIRLTADGLVPGRNLHSEILSIPLPQYPSAPKFYRIKPE
jgi:hypothetical protein